MPNRTPDTMSEAIALSSPSGRMSKRARDAATKRLGKALFEGWTREDFTGRDPQPTWEEKTKAHIKWLRDLASGGISVRKLTKEAERLQKQLDDRQ